MMEAHYITCKNYVTEKTILENNETYSKTFFPNNISTAQIDIDKKSWVLADSFELIEDNTVISLNIKPSEGYLNDPRIEDDFLDIAMKQFDNYLCILAAKHCLNAAVYYGAFRIQKLMTYLTKDQIWIVAKWYF